MNLAGTPRFFFQRVLPLLAIPVVCGAAVDREDSVKFFTDQVYPILKEHCYRCHGEEEKLKGDFRITSREGLLHGGGLGPALDEADPKASLLLESVAYTNDDLQMPPKNRLSEDQVAVLTRWVTDHQAAYDPALEIAGEPAAKRGPMAITDEQRNWWAYRPIQPLTPPKVTDPAWEENGIDA
ncbi:MAG: hypothetical protein KDM63_12875, partial [Verrucomicrobiae bacterium]|nr:hypothetical protein [Verrucomicrobiae bacterium]